MNEKAKDGKGISTEDDVFEQGGYLIVNFQIETFKKGEAHLIYNGGNSNMWQKEGFDNTPDPPTGPKKFNDGDVVVVDLGRSTNDTYSPGLFDIN